MAQIYTVDCFAPSNVGQSDLQNMENNFAALKSNFSGTTAPTTSVEAGQSWFDTSNKLLRIRNQVNNAWLGVMYGNTTNLIYMYLNVATDGWVASATVTDRVLALAGGSTYATPGLAGTWTQANHTHTGPSHTHTGPSHAHTISHTHTVSYLSWGASNVGGSGRLRTGTPDSSETVATSDKTTSAESAANSGAEGTGATGAAGTGATGGSATVATWRPAAAVGRLFYPNV